MEYRESVKYDSSFSYTHYAPFTWIIDVASFVLDIEVKALYKTGDFLCLILDKFGNSVDKAIFEISKAVHKTA